MNQRGRGKIVQNTSLNKKGHPEINSIGKNFGENGKNTEMICKTNANIRRK